MQLLVDDLMAGREQLGGVVVGPGFGVLDLDHAEAAELSLGAVEVAVAVAVALDEGVAGDVVADLDAVDDVGRERQPRLPRAAGGAVLEVVLRRGGVLDVGLAAHVALRREHQIGLPADMRSM